MKQVTPFLLVALTILLTGAGCASTTPERTVETPTRNVQAPETITPTPATNTPSEPTKIEAKAEVIPTPTEPAVKPTMPPKTIASIKEFSILAKNWVFEPATITVKKGDTVKLNIKSVDVNHGLTIAAFNVSTKLNPGETETVEFVADKAGSFSFFCSVFCGSGHREMKGTLIVTE